MSEETVQPQRPDTEPVGTPRFDAAEHAPPSPFPAAGDSSRHDETVVSWTASEFIVHHKSAAWYGAVAAATLTLAAITFLITQDKISTGTIILVGILFCIAAARKPRVLTYTLDHDGLTLGQHFRPYADFRSFSVVREGPFASIDLLPLKRFMPLMSVYFSPEDEGRVMDMLAEHIPFEERSHALVDRFMRNIRF